MIRYKIINHGSNSKIKTRITLVPTLIQNKALVSLYLSFMFYVNQNIWDMINTGLLWFGNRNSHSVAVIGCFQLISSWILTSINGGYWYLGGYRRLPISNRLISHQSLVTDGCLLIIAANTSGYQSGSDEYLDWILYHRRYRTVS